MAKNIFEKATDEIKKATENLAKEIQKQGQSQSGKKSSFYEDYQSKRVQPSTVQNAPQKKTFIPVTPQRTAFVPSTVVQQQPQQRKFVPVTRQPAYTQMTDLTNNRLINRFTPQTGVRSTAPTSPFAGSIYGMNNFNRSLPKAQSIFRANRQQQELLKRQHERDEQIQREIYGNLYDEEMEKQRNRSFGIQQRLERNEADRQRRMRELTNPARVLDAMASKESRLYRWGKNAALSGLFGIAEGTNKALDWVLPTEVIFGEKNDPLKTLSRDAENYRSDYHGRAVDAAKDKTGNEAIAEYGTQFAEGLVRALPQLGIAYLTAGTSAAPSMAANSGSGSMLNTLKNIATNAAKSPSFWYSVGTEGGDAYHSAKEKGASEEQAQIAGTVTGILNGLVEVSGGIENIPGQERTLKSWVANALGEGLEETTQRLIGNTVDKMVWDNNKQVFSFDDQDAIINPKRMAEEGLMGAAIGGVYSGVPMVAGYVNDTVNTGRAINEMGEGQSVINRGLASERESAANRYAQRLQNKANPSDWNIGRQFQKNVKAIQSENDFAAAMSKIKPTDIRSELYNDRGQELNGIATDSGVSVSVNGDIDVPTAIKHEWLHMFEKLNPEAYKSYRTSVLSAARETNSEAVENRIEFLKNEYNYNQTVAEDEIVAELTGGFNTNAIMRMAEGNNSLATRLADAMRTAKRQLRQAYTKGNYTSSTGLQLTFEQLNNAEKQYIQRLQQARDNAAENGDNADKFSVKEQTTTPQFKEWFGDWQNSPENASKVVNEDGTPMIVYHGTDSDFTVFDRSKGRSGMDIQGMFFSPWEIDAGGYGKNVGAYYLDIKNPASGEKAFKALNMFKGQNYAGIKAREYLEEQGYDGVNFYGEEWVAFEPTQIKSATNNIGTFDRNNPDIRYSVKEGNEYTPDKIARRLINENNAKGRVYVKDVREGITELARMVPDVFSGNVEENYPAFEAKARSIAETIVDASRQTQDVQKEQYNELRKWLKSERIKITDELKSDIPDFNAYRKSLMGLVTFSKNGTGIDQIYKELSERFPQYFNEQEQMTQSDQLTHLVDTLQNLKNYETAVSDKDYDAYVEDLTQQIVSEAMNLAPNLKQTVQNKSKADRFVPNADTDINEIVNSDMSDAEKRKALEDRVHFIRRAAEIYLQKVKKEARNTLTKCTTLSRANTPRRIGKVTARISAQTICAAICSRGAKKQKDATKSHSSKATIARKIGATLPNPYPKDMIGLRIWRIGANLRKDQKRRRSLTRKRTKRQGRLWRKKALTAQTN